MAVGYYSFLDNVRVIVKLGFDTGLENNLSS